MHRKLLIIVAVIFSLITNAQETKLSISLRGNLSTPFGVYAGNDIDNSSFTQSGISFGSELTWHINQKLGLVIDFNQAFHPVNASELGAAMVYDDPFLTDMYIRTESYSLTTFMIGAVYKLKINNKISVNPKLLIGGMYGKTPYQLFFPEYYLVGPDYFTITSSRDYGIAFKGGGNIIYAFNKYVSMDLNIDLTYSKLKFGFNNYSGLIYKERDILFTNIGLGLVLKVF